MLEHVQADDRVETPLGDVLVNMGQEETNDFHARQMAEAFPQTREILGRGIGEDDVGAVDEELRQVTDARADLEHAVPYPRPHPIEHPAVEPGRLGEPLERRGAGRIADHVRGPTGAHSAPRPTLTLADLPTALVAAELAIQRGPIDAPH